AEDRAMVDVRVGIAALVQTHREALREGHGQARAVQLEVAARQRAGSGKPGAAEDWVELRHRPGADRLQGVAEEPVEVGKFVMAGGPASRAARQALAGGQVRLRSG